MECEKIEKNLLAYVDALKTNGSRDVLVEEIASHAKRCEICKTSIKKELNIQAALCSLPVKPMGESFRSRVIDSITEKELSEKKSHFITGFGLVLIASAMIWLVAVYVGGISNAPLTEIQSVVLGANSK